MHALQSQNTLAFFLSNLRGPDRLSAIFDKGHNFCYFLFVSCTVNPF